MRLASVFFYKVHNIPYRFRGKYRREKKPTIKDIMNMKWDIEREQQNMLLLRHPYITAEQSFGHMKDVKQEKSDKLIQFWHEEKNVKFSKRITIADRLNYYMVNESWD
ncbi:PREDICTED: uncharacterized protein LOC107191439 [Dufourea novaeangliae]|uniref:Ribosomal protein 63, mitochondrial n=1 Tax=Dufourea novaeangliae TaxID=178035 RepID=A0A154PNB1_DUFNO|nr:PREDICTED: uncharacterized protein LOC107191439 [Dufourea novaeangliae]KZC13356.1 hypothetical protein WN55_05954 [Dufourea novaeangliae]